MIKKLLDLAGDGGAMSARRMAIFVFAIRVAGAGLAYVSQIIMARWMGAYEYGIFSVVWTWIIILGIFACCGFSSSPNRFIPELTEKEETASLRGFLRSSRLIALSAATILAALGMLAVWALRPTIDACYILPAIIILFALPMFSPGSVQDSIARSYDWPLLAMMPTFIWRPLLILGIILALVLSGQPATAVTAAIAAVIATWTVAITQYVTLRSKLRTRVEPGPRDYQLGTWLAVSLPMLLVEGFLQLITSADVIMVSLWHPPDDVAVYFAASKTLALVHFVYFAVRAASAHRFSKLHHAGDHEGLSAYVRMATRWTFLPSLAAGLMLLLITPLLLKLFGEGFERGYPLIAILMAGVVARASVGPADALLTMSGHQRVCASIFAATFAVNVVLNFIFIPWLGLPGAALATALAILFEAICLATAVRRKLNVNTFILPIPAIRRDPAS